MQEISEKKRFTRNLSEKRRRDTFNVIINELAAIVSGDGEKLDKSNVLRQTINFLRRRKEIVQRPGDDQKDDNNKKSSRNSSGASSDFEWLLFLQQAANAFLLVISDSGRVLFASDNCLDNLQRDKFIEHLLDPDDWTSFQLAVKKCTLYSIFDDTYSFNWRLKSTGQFYKNMKVKVCGKFISLSQLDQSVQSSCSQCAFCAVCAPVCLSGAIDRQPTIADCHQFSCTYSLEWNLLRVDENWCKITGWHSYEVIGRSGYDFCHPDDLDTIASDHETLMCCKKVFTKKHRLLTKSFSWLSVESHCAILESERHVLCTYWLQGERKALGEIDISSTQQSSTTNAAPKRPSGESVQRNRGVSIAHSPLLPEEGQFCPASADSLANDAIELSESEERLLCETLVERQASLQKQIAQYQTELCLLKSRLYESLGVQTFDFEMEQSHQSDKALESFLEVETQRQQFQSLVNTLTSKCWDLCVADRLGPKMEAKSQTCIDYCVNRMIDGSQFIVKRLQDQSSKLTMGHELQ